jgi:hypothetical protein
MQESNVGFRPSDTHTHTFQLRRPPTLKPPPFFSGLNYNPLKQGKTFGIIKNPDAFLDVISNYTGISLPSVNRPI